MMLVKEVMQTDVKVTKPQETVRFAAETMEKENVGSLAVLRDGVLIGMVTGRDIAVRGDSFGKDPMVCTVEEVMSRDLVYCHEDDDVKGAAEVMAEKGVRRMPVVAGDDKSLVGMLTVADIAANVDEELAGRIVERHARTA